MLHHRLQSDCFDINNFASSRDVLTDMACESVGNSLPAGLPVASSGTEGSAPLQPAGQNDGLPTLGPSSLKLSLLRWASGNLAGGGSQRQRLINQSMPYTHITSESSLLSTSSKKTSGTSSSASRAARSNDSSATPMGTRAFKHSLAHDNSSWRWRLLPDHSASSSKRGPMRCLP